MNLRHERENDYAQVYRVNHLAFGRENEARLVDALRLLPGTISLVAECNGEVVGHILFSQAEIETASGPAPTMTLAPLAVHPARQNQGVGMELTRYGLEVLGEEGHPGVIVLGHPNYYPRFGFQPASRWGIRSPFEVPDEAFMALELVPGAFDRLPGTLRYPPPFDMVEEG